MVRRAEIKDAGILAALAVRMWPDNDLNGLTEEFRQSIKNGDSASFLTYIDGKPAAFAQCQLRRDYVEGTDSSPAGYLEGIFVTEEYRGKGCAAELLAECEKWAKKTAVRNLPVTVNWITPAA